jgi:hypothetical protein
MPKRVVVESTVRRPTTTSVWSVYRYGSSVDHRCGWRTRRSAPVPRATTRPRASRIVETTAASPPSTFVCTCTSA